MLCKPPILKLLLVSFISALLSFNSYAKDTEQLTAEYKKLANGPSAELVKNKLREAFGGKEALQGLRSFEAKLTIRAPQEPTKSSRSFYSFARKTIAKQDTDGSLSMLKGQHAIKLVNENVIRLSRKEVKSLAGNMKLNFFYLLRNKHLKLIGPLEVAEHPNESWWIFKLRKTQSPPIGVDLKSGQIRKVLFDDGSYVAESNYQKISCGLNWPLNFTVFKGNSVQLQGEFSDIRINQSPSFETPLWFYP
ncbi:hypothetical protein [uncultured Pseudoteredinibacter sp.]|uniref:hypothetical protein n=1 Tax=uncultured Pseudoteredinibacter sp. TaxID=1641701 RepID=UPI002639C7B3|nr:hypothetical protein [uncultured Pseudoteredinibacter sp.]